MQTLKLFSYSKDAKGLGNPDFLGNECDKGQKRYFQV